MKLALAAAAAVLAFPASAWGEATLVTRELPLGGQRLLASAAEPDRFNMVGLHWQGPGSVRFRVRTTSGRWTGWRGADAEPGDAPDLGTAEARRKRTWRIGAPHWTGPATRLDVRVRGRVRRLRAHYVWSPEEVRLERALQIAGSPRIITRQAWGANEAIRRDNPELATTLSAAVVHHTAGASPATPAQSAAIVRGIYAYHVRGNGWDDIGYNFLVDRFGQVFEGRYGGIERNVVGAHAQGFNTGSVGVALIGRYDGSVPAGARSALASLLAWRLDVAHVDPATNTPFVSNGNPRFRKGAPIWLRAVSGHRDTGYTSCPGAGLYGQLGTVAREARAIGLPKLFTPEIEGAVGQFVSFSARLSSSLPWTVTVTDANGRAVATGSGTGTIVRWTWDARLAPPGTYRYSIGAGPNARPAMGVLGRPTAALSVEGLRADPVGFTPNDDGRTDSTRISYALGAPATVTAQLQTRDGAALTTLFERALPAGRHSLVWDAAGWPDGRYRIAILARGVRGRVVSALAEVVVSRTLSGFTVTPLAISPNGDGRSDTFAVSYSLAVPALARISLRRAAAETAVVFNGPIPVGLQTLNWGGAVRDGDYSLALTVTDTSGSVTQTEKVRIDRRKPRLVRVARRPLRVSLSEPARVTLVADGVTTRVWRPKAGVFRVVLGRPLTRLVAFAEDRAGNVSARVRLR